MRIDLNYIDWNAVGAISTALGLLVAFLLPSISQSRKYKKIRRMVQNELELSFEILDKAIQEKNSTANIELIKQIETKIWENSYIQYSETTSPEIYHYINQSYINLKKIKDLVMGFDKQYIITVIQFMDLQRLEKQTLHYKKTHIKKRKFSPKYKAIATEINSD